MMALVYISVDSDSESEDLQQQVREKREEINKARVNELRRIKRRLLVLEASIKRMEAEK